MNNRLPQTISRLVYNKAGSVLLTAMVLLMPFAGIAFSPATVEAAGWLNDNWGYRVEIDISGNSSDLTDIQYQLTGIDTQSLYDEGKLQNNCQDIRFTNANGALLHYWIEDNDTICADDSSTDFWVRLPRVAASGTKIYMYYGNPNANSYASGDRTFEFFDDLNRVNADWYNSSWGARQRFKVNSKQVADGSLSDFPVYVDLSLLGSDFWSQVDTQGDDIVVTEADGITKLDRELVSIDTGTETGELWFKAPVLSGTEDTYFYIYFANASATETNDESTWSSNYVMVQHLDDTSAVDSTSNSNDGSTGGTPDIEPGITGNALHFDGSTEYISVPSSGTNNLTTNFSTSAWVNIDDTSVFNSVINKVTNSSDKQFALSVVADGLVWIDYERSANDYTLGGTNIDDSTWYRLDLTISSSRVINVYINGEVIATATAPAAVTTSSNALNIARYGGSYNNNHFDGLIDLATLSNTEREPEWIQTEYNNQSNPAKFVSFDGYEAISIEQSSDAFILEGSPEITESGTFELSDAGSIEGLQTPQQFGINSKAIIRASQTSTSMAIGRFGFSNTAFSVGTMYADDATYFIFNSPVTNWDRSIRNDGTATNGTGSISETTDLSEFEIGWRTGGVDFRVNNSNTGSLTGGNTPDEDSYVRLESDNTSDTVTLDWVAVANYDPDPPDSQVVGSEEIGNGPAIWYTFDNENGQSVIDRGYLALDGVMGSTNISDNNDPARFDSCISGSCLLFDGSNDYVLLGTNSIRNTDSSTGAAVSFWFKSSSTQTSQAVFSFEAWYSLYAHFTGGGGITAFFDGSSGGNPQTSEVFTDGKWHHVVAQTNGTTTSVYVDGQQLLSFSETQQDLDAVSGTSYLGINNGSTNPYSGLIDEFKFYQRTLSNTEILAEYNSTADVLGDSNDQVLDSLEGWWKFNESSWNGTADEITDYSGNNFHGQIANDVSVAQGIYGNSADFDGTGDYVTGVGNQPLLTFSNTDPFSISAWVNTTTTSIGTIVSKMNDSSPYQGYDLQFQADGTIRMYLVNTWSTNAIAVDTVDSFNDGLWHNVAVTYDGSSSASGMRIYVDGVDVAQTTIVDNLTSSSASAINFHIGIRVGGVGSSDYDGLIDEVRVYSKELSQTEIDSIYSYRPDPIAHWKFDEKSGSTAKDSVLNGSNGTLTNMDNSDWVNGRIGGALSFDGSDDFVSLPDDSYLPLGTDSRTFSFWVNPASQTIGDRLFSMGDWAAGNAFDFVWNSGNTISVIGHTNNYLSTGSISTNTWTHIMIVLAENNLKIYINGVLDSEQAVSLTTISDGEFRLGGSIDDRSATNLDGKLDDFRIYNYALSDTEAYKLYQGDSFSNSGGGQYERIITLSSPTPEDNYQVRVILDSFDYSKVQANGEDIRFYENGNEIDYWIETWNPAGTSVIWAEVANTGTTAISMEYGDPSAAAGSSGDDTFLYFTDLTTDPGIAGSNSSHSYANWYGGGYVQYRFRRDCGSAVNRYWDLPSSISEDSIAVDLKWTRIGYSMNQYGDSFGIIGLSQTTGPGSTMVGWNFVQDTDSSSTPAYRGYTLGSAFGSWNGTNGTAYQITSAIDGTDRYFERYQNGSLVSSATSTTAGQAGGYNRFNVYRQNYGNCQDFNNATAQLDDIRVRKWDSSVEPLSTSVQSEGVSLSSVNVTEEYEDTGYATPIMQFNLDEKTGTTAQDQIGTYSANLVNIDDSNHVAGDKGKALSFNGTDEYGDISPSVQFDSGEFAVSMWINSTADTTGIYDTIWHSGYSGGNHNFEIDLRDNEAYVNIRDSAGSSINLDGTIDVNDGEWHHIVVTRVINTFSLYIDGQLDQSTSVALGDIDNTGATTRIGNAVIVASRHYTGSIDTLKVWDSGFSAREVAKEYNNGAPVGWWKLDQGEGTTVYDYSGNDNHGTMVNMTPASDWLGSDSCIINGCMDFDGSNDYVNIPHDSALMNSSMQESISFAAWHRPSSIGVRRKVFAKGTDVGTLTDYSYEITLQTDGRARCTLGSSSVAILAYSTTVLTPGEWYHTMCTYDGQNLNVYLNGVLETQEPATQPIYVEGGPLQIGREHDNGSGSDEYPGRIDEVKIWNYTLSHDDVIREFNSNGAALRYE